MLVLLLLAPVALAQRATTPATPFFPFEGIDDPNKQCVDISCFEPIKWSDDKKEVCRYRKERTCTPRTMEVCDNVPITECELVGYTECTTSEATQPLRDDKVVGEFFYEQTCETSPIAIIERKMKPECRNETKNVCEKMWVPEAPFWKDVNCQQLAWENCTLVEHPHEVNIDYCSCTPTEIWYNKYEYKDASVGCLSTTCEPKTVPKCTTREERKCTTVSWEECQETCANECSEMHFKEPSQEADHRRWCSHVEIEVPAGVSRVPRGARSLRTGGSGQRQAQAQRQAQVQRQAFGSQQVASSRLVQRPREGKAFSSSPRSSGGWAGGPGVDYGLILN